MGVAGLPQLLKEVASKEVRLDGCGENEGSERHIIVDGHFALHRAASNASAAVSMVVHDNIEPLANIMAHRLNVLRSAGWELTVVFDGRTPPGKANTAQSRASVREGSRQTCLKLLQEGVPANHPDLEAAAKRAVHFSSFVVARVARLLVSRLRCTCIRAPYESDGQLAFLEHTYLTMGREVIVHGTDSDLLVLGVRALLWEVREDEGRVFGQVYARANLVRPQLQVLRSDGEGGEFLRLLHGILDRGGANGDGAWWYGQEADVMERLRAWAGVAGNDYSKFRGIGPKRAMDICLRHGSLPTLSQLASAISPVDGRPPDEVEAILQRSKNMTLHPVVYCIETGRQQHLSGCDSADDITRETGGQERMPSLQ